MIDRPAFHYIAAAAVALCTVAAIVWHFHDQFWWPADEGVYAYVAQRILAGDRLHRDLIDLHGGYGNLINVMAFRIFGEDLLSLRFPLAVLTVVQSGLVFLLIKERGPIVAAVGALAAGSLSFVQFLNPSANWYALFLCIATIAIATQTDVTRGRSLALLGFAIGLCFLTRQLSGVLLAIGTVTWLMLRSSEQTRHPAFAGRLFAGVLAIGLAGYLISKSSLSAIALVGFGPLLVVAIAVWRVRLDISALGRILFWLSLGAAAASFPLVIYNLMNGALVSWIHDIFVTALLIHGQDFIAQASFWNHVQFAMGSLVAAPTIMARVSSLGWLVAILIVPLTAYLCVRFTIKTIDPAKLHPLPVIAPFWAVVSIHYQIPIYLFFVLPIVTAALLALSPRPSVIISVGFLAVWAVISQAGQPLSRNLTEMIEGERSQPGVPASLPGVSLRISADDREIFASVINTIETAARPGELLMTLPMDPELNFIVRRKSPVRYYGTQLGLVTKEDVNQTLEQLDAAAPIFVVLRRNDKYLTPLSIHLLEEIQSRSPAPVSIGPFDLYRLPSSGASLPEPPRE